MAARFFESLYVGYYQSVDLNEPLLADERSAFQHIQIFDTPLNGRMMVLDGIIQITDRDECTYSEMLSHVPLIEHGSARRVMIVGGGDGAIAEEVLKHPGIELVDLVDIDGRVIELCKKHFDHVAGAAFRDKRLNVYAEDAFEFLKAPAARGRYDLIIADRPDPVGPAAVLFADEFYKMCRDALTPQGFACFQTGVPFYQADELAATLGQLAGVFPRWGFYLTVVPTYTGGYMGLTWASKEGTLNRLPEAELSARCAKIGLKTDYYTPAIHKGAFNLPPWIERLIPAELKAKMGGVEVR